MLNFHRFGPSTITFSWISIEDAIARVRNTGFHTIELFIATPLAGCVGYFRDPQPVLCPKNLNNRDREKIRHALEKFENVIIHVQLADNNIASINPDIRSFAGRIVEVHAHGLYGEVGTIRDHNDWDRNNCINWVSIVQTLKSIRYDGPVVFEISARDTDMVIKKSLEFRENLMQIWEKDEAIS